MAAVQVGYIIINIGHETGQQQKKKYKIKGDVSSAKKKCEMIANIRQRRHSISFQYSQWQLRMSDF